MNEEKDKLLIVDDASNEENPQLVDTIEVIEDNMEKIVVARATYVASAVNKSQYPESSLPEVAFLGRSNVGKSSLLNIQAYILLPAHVFLFSFCQSPQP